MFWTDRRNSPVNQVCDIPSVAMPTVNREQRLAELIALQNALNSNSSSAFHPATVLGPADGAPAALKTAPLSASTLSTTALPQTVSAGEKLPTKCDRYKTELCRTFEENGTCRYGDKCQFAHGATELRSIARHPKYKTDLCRTFHTTGFCPYGSRCHFIHSLHEGQLPTQSTGQRRVADLLPPPNQSAKVVQMLPPQAHLAAQQQSMEQLLIKLSSLIQASELTSSTAGPAAGGSMVQDHDRRFALLRSSAAADPHLSGFSYFSDSVDSLSPCPSPTSTAGSHEEFFSSPVRPFTVNFAAPSAACMQSSAASLSSGVLTPPSSPSSATSSLNCASRFADFDCSDAAWHAGTSVWPCLLSPVKDEQTLVPDFAQSQLLRASRSIFA